MKRSGIRGHDATALHTAAIVKTLSFKDPGSLSTTIPSRLPGFRWRCIRATFWMLERREHSSPDEAQRNPGARRDRLAHRGDREDTFFQGSGMSFDLNPVPPSRIPLALHPGYLLDARAPRTQ